MLGTVKVRIAVAVDPEGRWKASGWWLRTDAEAAYNATSVFADDPALFWLTAELPVPTPKGTEVVPVVEEG